MIQWSYSLVIGYSNLRSYYGITEAFSDFSCRTADHALVDGVAGKRKGGDTMYHHEIDYLNIANHAYFWLAILFVITSALLGYQMFKEVNRNGGRPRLKRRYRWRLINIVTAIMALAVGILMGFESPTGLLQWGLNSVTGNGDEAYAYIAVGMFGVMVVVGMFSVCQLVAFGFMGAKWGVIAYRFHEARRAAVTTKDPPREHGRGRNVIFVNFSAPRQRGSRRRHYR